MISPIVAIVIVAYIGCTNAVSCPNVGQEKLTPANRDVVLNRHNELRSKLAFGTVEYRGGGRLKSGKNIYELSWDCNLEKIAQNWANTCRYGHSTSEYREKAGENIYQWSTSGERDSTDTNLLRATNMWWDEIKEYDASRNTDNIMGNDVLSVAGHWSQQAWGATTKIGCGVANCSDGSWKKTYIVCNYLIAGNFYGKPIFEWGNGCSKDSDCTTYERSKCNTQTKLCLTEGQTVNKPSQPKGGEKELPKVTKQPKPTEEREKRPKVTQPGAKVCKDLVPGCYIHVKFCHLNYIKDYCHRTCKVCTGPPVDLYEDCESYVTMAGGCKEPAVRNVCEKTCEEK